MLVKDLNATAHNVINAGKFFTIDDFNKCLELFGEESERKSFYRRMWKLKSLTESSGDNVQQTNNDENQTVPGILTLESLKNALDKRKGKFLHLLVWSIIDIFRLKTTDNRESDSDKLVSKAIELSVGSSARANCRNVVFENLIVTCCC